MVDKNLFTQDLKNVYTVLQELKIIEKYVKNLIENNNLLELKVDNLDDAKIYIDSIKDYINQDGNNTEIGGNLEVDGNIILNTTSDLQFKDGSLLKTPLYRHNVNMIYSYSGEYKFSFISSKSTPYSNEELLEYLKDNNIYSFILDYDTYGNGLGNINFQEIVGGFNINISGFVITEDVETLVQYCKPYNYQILANEFETELLFNDIITEI